MFIRKQLAHLSVVTLAALSCAALAADRPGYPSESASSGAQKRMIVNDTTSSVDLVGQIIGNWEATLTRTYGWQQDGVEDLRQRVSALPTDTLKSLAGAASWQRFTELMLDAERAIAAPAMSQKGFALDERNPDVAKIMQDSRKLLGDQNRDLVFIPTKPCRIFDTRFETTGSPYAGRYTAGNTKNFWAFNFSGPGDFSTYGGNTGCIENVQSNASTFAGTAPYAVMIKLTIVGPAAANSYVSAVRSGDTNPAPNLVSAFCDQAGVAPCFATVVVPVCRGTSGCTGTRDISIDSNMGLDLAGEVQGYFIKPQATALSCTTTTATSSPINVSSGTNFYNFAVPALCPAGTTEVSMRCSTDNALASASVYDFTGNNSNAQCEGLSLANTHNLRANRVCCNTPGR